MEYAVEIPCEECRGEGRIILDDRDPWNWHECQVCGGHGEVTVDIRYYRPRFDDVDVDSYMYEQATGELWEVF